MTAADLQLLLCISGTALFGLFAGRFLNICIERFPEHDALSDQLKSLRKPWNVCRKCAVPPTSLERLPVISWITTGRCHACNRKLPRAFPVIEVITALLFGLVYWREISTGGILSSKGLISSEGPAGPEIISNLWSTTAWLHLRYAFHMIMICGLIVATEIDRRYRIIPDGSTVPIMVFAVIVSGIFAQLYTVPIWFQDASTVKTLKPLMPLVLQPLFVPWDSANFVAAYPHFHGLLVSVMGLIVGATSVWTVRQIGFITLKQEAMGFGDVVLMAMIGSVVGWQPVLAVFVVGAPMLAVLVAITNWIANGDNEIPYGPFLSGATILLLLTWPVTWPFAKRFLDMGPLLILMCIGGACSLAVMLYVLQIVKRLFGFESDNGNDDGGWSSADHLTYHNSERPDEQTGQWPTQQWPGSRAGRGLRCYHDWKTGN
jgi:leader peptidase (prepilin peptidase)/N-methyltransferase